MDAFDTPLDLVRSLRPDQPVALARPHRLAHAAAWLAARFPGDIHYAVKANASSWAIRALADAGLTHFDVASPSELALVAEHAPGAAAAFMNPVKNRRAIAQAYFDLGCRAYALDHGEELGKIIEETGAAKDLTLVVRLSVDNLSAAVPLAGKFGASVFDGPALLRAARGHAAKLGVTFHVGSQCMDPAAYARAMAAASALITRAGVTVDLVNVGGGLPALYPGYEPPPLGAYMDAIIAARAEMPVLRDAALWCEPGRALVAEGGGLLARIELRKGDALYVNDGAFGHLFDAAHLRWRYPARLVRADGEPSEDLAPYRLFGPTCDSMDAMPGPFPLPVDAREGDYIEFGMLGAYGAAMASRFNGFGETQLAVMRDWPWRSLYDEDYAAAPVDPPPPRRQRGRGAAEAGARR